MEFAKIAGMVDHTLFKQMATWEQIKGLCDDAIHYQTASVCTPTSYVKQAKEYVGDTVRVCTVIGFPNGYSTRAVKMLETQDAVQNGADETDVVISIGWVKNGLYDQVAKEIKQIKQACGGRILRVIVETYLLTEEEKIRMCEIVTRSGADFIKTSTGFSTGGATLDDVTLFAKHVGPGIRIKTAGRIVSMEDAECFLSLGVFRLGTNRIIQILKNEDSSGQYQYGLNVFSASKGRITIRPLPSQQKERALHERQRIDESDDRSA